MNLRHCELCSAEAAVYCPSDAAFLCGACDAMVHNANFLVARHVRRSVCSHCGNPTGNGLSGAGFHPHRATCTSCYPASDDCGSDGVSGYSSCSSDCISSTTSPEKEYPDGRGSGSSSTAASEESRRAGGTRRVDYMEAEGVFSEWCGRLGLVGADVAVRMACKGLRACSGSWTVVPFSVCLAASMWLGLRLGGNESAATWQVLKRLEEVSDVPARIILAAELKLERGLRIGARFRMQRRRLELVEESAES